MSIQQILTKYWGYSSFRPLQEEIINAVLEGNDTLALLPTGGGKSICFQVPAMLKEGICVVISPLIALMKDQVENLKKRGIPAVAVVSGMSRKEIDIALDNCIYGNLKFLYLSPERLTSEIVQLRIEKMNINLIAVDEAHCISQWGYDFRPPYLKIADIRIKIPNVPILALTATATLEVKKDIQEKLLFKNGNVFQNSFERKNLAYIVIYEENKLQRLLNIVNKVSGTGIVYVRSRKKTKEIADFLRKNKITADYYHAGLPTQQRNQKQDDWKSGKTRIIVATNAFGMGIDKANVRTVVHLDFPDSLEAYYQEAGRAGRDEQKAYTVLLYNNSDVLNFKDNIERNFPTLDEIKTTYQALANYYQLVVGAGEGTSFDFMITDFCKSYNLSISTVFNSLKILELEGYISSTDAVFLPSRLHVPLSNQDLYDFELTHPRYEHFIKTILRSYEGLFDNYVKIQEKELAARAGITYEEAITFLTQLAQQQVLNYLPQKDAPQIIFTHPRVDTKHLHISKENLSERKTRTVLKANAVIDYATKKTTCRSQMLLAYLGETESHRCGNCDVCLERNKLQLSDLEFTMAKEQIKKLLTNQTLSLEEILKNVKGIREDKTIKVIQWLIDNKKLAYTEENKLRYVVD